MVGSIFSLASNSVSTNALQDSSVSTAKLADAAVSSAKLAANAVSSANLMDGSVFNEDINSAANIAFSKLAISKSDIVGLGIPSSDTTTTYSAGNGLFLVGSQFNLASNSVSTNALQDSSVSTAKLADAAVTSAKLAANAVSSANLMDGSVFNEDINSAANIAFSKLAISKSDIVGLGIPSSDTTTTYSAGNGLFLVGSQFNLASNSVSTNALQDSSVSSAKLADAAVSSAKLADDSVTSAKITDGSITNSDIQTSAAIAFSKLKIVKSDIVGLGIPSSDTTYSTGTGLTMVGTRIGLAVSGVSTNAIQASAVNNAKIADSAITSAKISDLTITNSDISNSAAIAYNKLSLTGSLLSTDLADSAVTSGKIADNAITSAKISDASITNSDISNSAAIAYHKLNLSGSILGSDLADGTLSTAKLEDSAITSAKILDTTIANADISNSAAISYYKLNLENSILSTDLADNAVTNSKLEDTSVTSAKIADDSITNDDINSTAAISYNKLNLSGAIQSSDLANGSITSEKLASGLSTSGLGDTTSVFSISATTTDDNSKVLSLDFTNVANPNSTQKFIQFQGSSTEIGSIHGNGSGGVDPTIAELLHTSSDEALAFSKVEGIVLSSSGADYAEYIPRKNSSDVFTSCDIVGVKQGKLITSTLEADQYMVISQKPIVIGNTPSQDKLSEFNLVSFIGQVFVKVQGKVHSGQYIVASQKFAGIGIAKWESELTPEDCKRIVGMAWETSLVELRIVKVGITARSFAAAYHAELLALKNEIQSIKGQLQSK